MTEKRPDYLPEHIRETLIHDPRVAEQDLRVEVIVNETTVVPAAEPDGEEPVS